METELKAALDAHGAAIDAAITKYDGQLAENGKVDDEIRAEVKTLTERFEASVRELAQKMDSAESSIVVPSSAGAEFVKSDAFKRLVQDRNGMARVEVKNTVGSGSTTALITQLPGVIPGLFLPLTVRSQIPSITVATDVVRSLRQLAWTNAAAPAAQAAAKAESSATFEQYNVQIEVVAHFIKASNQLLADAPAVVQHIDLRLRDGVAQSVEAQLLVGTGVTPQLSGMTIAANRTLFVPALNANLVESINAAKYQLWAIGAAPDTVVVNPADWGALERMKSTTNEYLYGAPGTAAGVSPFGITVVLSNHMPVGQILVGSLRGAATIYQHHGVVVEMGFVNDDFTRNLVTIRAEERLGLAVDIPSKMLYGPLTRAV